MHVLQLSTCETTEVMQGLLNPRCMRYMETSVLRDRTTSSSRDWAGHLTATADEGFPTPSSSGREASGAADSPQTTRHTLHSDAHSVDNLEVSSCK